MLPLGDRWAGICRANPGSAATPPAQAGENSPRSLCNLGYARQECPRFPGGDAPDAVRFTVSRDDGAALHLYYVVERDHQPFAHGPLEFSPSSAAFTNAPPGETLRNQAAAYLDSFLRRKSHEQETEAAPRRPASK